MTSKDDHEVEINSAHLSEEDEAVVIDPRKKLEEKR